MEVTQDSEGFVWHFTTKSEHKAAEKWNRYDWSEKVAGFLEKCKELDPLGRYVILENLNKRGAIIGVMAMRCEDQVMDIQPSMPSQPEVTSIGESLPTDGHPAVA